MKIKVSDKKWYSRTQFRNMERLAKHVMEHYPKDSALHKAVWNSFKSCEQTERKLWTGWKAASKKTAKPRRKSTVRRRTARRTPAKRRTSTRRTARRAAPKRRTAARRTYRRTTRRTRRSA
jgi:hypothetical protein